MSFPCFRHSIEQNTITTHDKDIALHEPSDENKEENDDFTMTLDHQPREVETMVDSWKWRRATIQKNEHKYFK